MAAIAVLFAGCGEGDSETQSGEQPPPFQSLSISIDGEAGPESAGILTAYMRSQLEDVGVGLNIYSPAVPDRPIEYVVERTVDLGVSHEPQVAMARENGVPIVAIGSLVPEPTMAMIWLEKSKIGDIADLKGKTIAIPGVPFQKRFLAYVLAQAGLSLSDVELQEANYELVPWLLSGRADAIFGGSWNVEGARLEAQGAKPVITRAEELGIPPYDELVVIAREDAVSKDPQLFERFMEGVGRGTETAVAEPEAALRAIYEIHENPARLEWKATEAGVEETLPLLSKTGRIDREQATHLLDWMREQGMIQREPPLSEMIVGP